MGGAQDGQAAGNIMSLFPLAIIVGSPFLGYVSDQLLRSRKKVIVGTSVVNAACWLAMLLFFDRLSVAALCLLFFIMGVAAGSPGNVGFAAIKESFPARMAGTAIGAVNLAGFFGSVVFQPAIGYVLDSVGKVGAHYQTHGYRIAFLIFRVLTVVALIGALWTKETMSRNGRRHPQTQTT